MRKLIAAAIAAAMLTPAIMAAPAQAGDRDRYERHHDRDHYYRDRHDRYSSHDRRDHHGDRDHYRERRDYREYRDHHRYAGDHRWSRGDRFDRRYVRYYRPVRYYDYRSRLYAPPHGHHWVRADNDALLIGVTSGIVSAIVSNAFYR